MAFDAMLQKEGITGYVCEYAFKEGRRWRFDFAFPDLKIAVEIHGAINDFQFKRGKFKKVRGDHLRKEGYTNDRAKVNEAIILGWKVIELTPDQLYQGAGIRWLKQLLEVVKNESTSV